MNYEHLQRVLSDNDYLFYDEGDYNLNLIGIRSANRDANTFNDQYCIAFRSQSSPVVLSFPCTTDPGFFYRTNPLSDKGTGILKAGQYRSAFKIGFHQGKYLALVQRKPVTLIRDNNHDHALDLDGELDSGFFGVNHHYASSNQISHYVDKWSAACQVFADRKEHDILMALCEKSASLYGNSFTYTLINESDL